ncbi:MAG: hypothetical protein B6242_16805 [Anaerolineaceae bacterium 4572_78]|nr:MAG: hypothetical protein B6242_16805 [Anaerolineaceae bacterium 4572_78]
MNRMHQPCIYIVPQVGDRSKHTMSCLCIDFQHSPSNLPKIVFYHRIKLRYRESWIFWKVRLALTLQKCLYDCFFSTLEYCGGLKMKDILTLNISRVNVRTKIMIGYVIVLALIILLGWLAMSSMQAIKDKVDYLSTVLLEQKSLSEQVANSILTSQVQANRYIANPESEDTADFEAEITHLKSHLKDLSGKCTGDRLDDVNKIETSVTEYEITFSQIYTLTQDRQIFLDTLFKQSETILEKIRQLQNNAFAANDIDDLHQLTQAMNMLHLTRLDIMQYIITNDEQYVMEIETYYNNLIEVFVALNEQSNTPSRRQLAQDATVALKAFYDTFNKIHDGFIEQGILVKTKLDVQGTDIHFKTAILSRNIDKDFSIERDDIYELYRRIQIGLAIASVVIFVIGVGLGLVISKRITDPLVLITKMLQQISNVDLQTLASEMGFLADGDLTRKLRITSQPIVIETNDEIGQIGHAFNGIITYLEMIERAFITMTTNLGHLVKLVTQNANQVSDSANKLNIGTKQSSEASMQLVHTIEQIARGSTEQSEVLQNAFSWISQMSQAIDNIARGAQEQASAVGSSSQITSKINKVIRLVADNAQAGLEDAEQASQAAQIGVDTVQWAINGMQSISQTVQLATRSVEKMGRHSQQIGAIIETIENIAIQTNLLALNASIEAARAGEHGKGFAIVADEVGQLADKSASAAKEIAELIHGIQDTVDEAVSSMSEGTTEVKVGMERADEAGKALNSILTIFESVNGQIKGISSAAQEMRNLSEGLVNAMDTVSSVVEENTAITEEVAANSVRLNEIIETSFKVHDDHGRSLDVRHNSHNW